MPGPLATMLTMKAYGVFNDQSGRRLHAVKRRGNQYFARWRPQWRGFFWPRAR